ncbi:MAG: iron-sulfur cluster assembly accessory protein [Gammaproteobacteria bacterium HGW-Gammaproteobacteria-2]|nr:MAG: iron-sulfur cluster assembly accessory protein [Gammaproteobacteria bacterium HGW-Gammaproteobacteria-2]
MAISLTPAALDHARKFVSGGNATGIRFGIKRTGCSGWGYVVELAPAVQADDSVFDVEGLQVLVDAQSLPLVDGTRIDYVRNGINQEFVFDNPNATAQCGCGESFTTRTEAA